MDLTLSLFLLSVTSIAAGCYLIRLVLRGRARFERVDRGGGSLLLGKGVMEMAHWSMQPVAYTLIRLKMTPNRISLISTAFGALAGYSLAVGHFGWAALTASLAAGLDILDGMVARLTATASNAGKVLDSTLDRYVEFFFFLGLAWNYRSEPLWLLVVLAALHGSFMVSYTTAMSEIQKVSLSRGNMRRPERLVYLLLAATLTPISALLGWSDVPMKAGLLLIASGANLSAALRLNELTRLLSGAGSQEPASRAERPARLPPQPAGK